MIGKTIFKYRPSGPNQKNKDVGLRAIVLSLSILMFVFCSSYVFSQPAPSTKSKPAVKSVPSAAEADLVDDNEEESAIDDKDDVEEMADENTQEIKQEITEKNDDASDTEDVVESPEKQVTKPLAETTKDDSEEPTEENSAQQAQNPENEPENLNDQAIEETQEKPAETFAKDPIVETKPEPPPIPEPPQSEPVLSAENTTDADYVEVIPLEKSVELVTRKSYTAYRDRRTTHGFLFNVGAENLYFPEYASIQDGKLYEELFGQEDLTLVQVNVSYKLNFFLGSLAVGAGYGQGSLIDDRSQAERTLTIEKKSVHGQILFDSLMREPYFVPYVGFNYWQLGLTEKNKLTDATDSRDTGNGTSMTIGFLMQLNWIEPETSKMAYLSHGLENTYLDIFWTQYQGTGEDDDPNFENDFNFGVGLKLEY